MQQHLDEGLVANALHLRQMACLIDIRHRYTNGDALGGYGGATPMFQQEVRYQIPMTVPPFSLLGFRTKPWRVNRDRSLLPFHNPSLTLRLAGNAVTTRTRPL